MICFKVWLILLMAVCSQGEILEVCDYQDFECLCRTTELFTNKTYAGIPQYDVKTLDPLFISEVVYEHNDDNGVFTFKNITLVGMKNQKLHQFRLDKDEQLVNIATKATLEASGNCEIRFKKFSKRFEGIFTVKFTEIGKVEYNYESKSDDKGVEHYIPGPEIFTMDFEGTLISGFDSELVDKLENDPVVSATWAEYDTKKESIVKASLFPMVKEAYKVAIHNIRAMAKILPKTAFFNNI